MQRAARRLSRTEQKARTRDRLLDAAGRVIGRRGLGGASVEEISEDAGYSTGAFYGNFKSKDEIFAAALEYHAAEFERFIRERGHAGSVGRRLTAEAEWLATVDAWQVLFLLEILTHGTRSDRLRPAVREYLAGARERIREQLEQGAAESGRRLPLPADRLAVLALAVEIGLLVQRLYDERAVDSRLLPEALGRFVE